MPLLSILIGIIIIALIYWAAITIARSFAVPPQILTVINVIFVVIVVLWLLSLIGLIPGPVLRLR